MKISSNRDLAQSMITNAEKKVKLQYSSEKMAENYIAEYNEVLKCGK